MKFAWIDAEKAHYAVSELCDALEVSRAGYYAWTGRPESKRALDDKKLTAEVHAAFETGRRFYGSPRVHRELAAKGIVVGRKRVIRLMRQEGLVARVRRRYKCTTMSDHDQPVAPNILERNFTPPRPNESWAGDVTELLTGNGKLYLAVILDLCSRLVVGWALSASNDRHLAMRALDVALRRRRPEAGLLHHTDQGSRMQARTTSACSPRMASRAR